MEETLQQNHVKQTNTATRRADCRGKDSRDRDEEEEAEQERQPEKETELEL